MKWQHISLANFHHVSISVFVSISYIFFIHSCLDGHLGCFHILATENSTGMNIRVHTSFQTHVLFPLGKHPEVKLLNQMVFFNLWGTSKLFFMETAQIYILSNSVQGFPFTTSLTTLILFLLVTATLTGRRGYLLGFWLALSWWLVMLSIFSCVCWSSVCLLGKISIQVLQVRELFSYCLFK